MASMTMVALRRCMGLLLVAAGAAHAGDEGPVVAQGAEWVSPAVVPDTVTVDMQNLPRAPAWRPGDPIIEIPRLFHGDPNAPTPVPAFAPTGGDPLVARQQAEGPGRSTLAFNTPLVNVDVLASAASPNDPTGDVGTHQFVAAINGPGGGQFAAYNKATGAVVVPPTLMETLGSGGACAAGLGDPIVLYDELARRWVLTEFTSGANVLCVYISDRANISGTVTWTRYAFTLPEFPDYPKYGVWPNAYYVGANEDGSAGARPFYAMDRVRMLAGQPATLQRLTIPNLAGFGFQMTQPADLSGDTPPPTGTPGLFVRHRDDEAHNAGSNNPTQDFLELYRFAVDWTTPANSTITGPQTFTIAEFSSNLNGLSAFEAFPQPNGARLDPLRETVMHRLAYRRIGNTEILFGNFVTDLFNGAGSTFPDDTGAVRWFELRRERFTAGLFSDGFEPETEPSSPWTLRQEGTFAPADGTPAEQIDRWMAASNIDADGNVALAYNVVRQTPALSASLRYTGRLANDTLGVMTAAETNIVTGAGNAGSVRWGDYNDMGIDPVDGCTFWFVGNYMNNARANRAAAFRHDACSTARFALVESTSRATVCANSASPTNATPIGIEVLAGAGFTAPVAFSLGTPLPTGINGSFVPPTVSTFPGTTVATLNATNGATPGTTQVVLRGTAGTQVKDVPVQLEVLTTTAAAPTLTAPANGAIRVDRTPTFTWQASATAAGYVVEASTSSTFDTTLFSQAVTGTSLVSPVNLPVDTQLFWRVRATNACGAGSNSTVFSFTTGLPAAPTLSAPANAATGVSTSPTFTWTAAAGATGYVVEASTSNTFGTTLFSQPVTGTSLSSPVALPASTPVFWRVRGTNGFGAGANSAVFSFTTGLEFCRTVNLPIPDNDPAGVSDEVVVTGVAANVTNLDVRVAINHTYVEDLTVRLTRVAPALTTSLMTNPLTATNGTCSGNDVRAVFDDSATTPAQTGCAAGTPTMNGAFVPQQALSAFNGQPANGTWRLTVDDNFPDDTGSLVSWCVLPN
jgi:hypothetical protein